VLAALGVLQLLSPPTAFALSMVAVLMALALEIRALGVRPMFSHIPQKRIAYQFALVAAIAALGVMKAHALRGHLRREKLRI
jgi:hypothetical protein